MSFSNHTPQNQLFGDPMIIRFDGEHRFLSNFYPCEIEFDGHVYKSVEHAYVAAKTIDEGEREEIRKIKTSGQVKKYGRESITLRPDWDQVKYEIMLELVRKKFSSEPLSNKLLATWDSYLIEGNWWGDTYWVVDEKTGKGQNKLGEILMRVRNELK